MGTRAIDKPEDKEELYIFIGLNDTFIRGMAYQHAVSTREVPYVIRTFMYYVLMKARQCVSNHLIEYGCPEDCITPECVVAIVDDPDIHTFDVAQMFIAYLCKSVETCTCNGCTYASSVEIAYPSEIAEISKRRWLKRPRNLLCQIRRVIGDMKMR